MQIKNHQSNLVGLKKNQSYNVWSTYIEMRSFIAKKNNFSVGISYFEVAHPETSVTCLQSGCIESSNFGRGGGVFLAIFLIAVGRGGGVFLVIFLNCCG